MRIKRKLSKKLLVAGVVVVVAVAGGAVALNASRNHDEVAQKSSKVTQSVAPKVEKTETTTSETPVAQETQTAPVEDTPATNTQTQPTNQASSNTTTDVKSLLVQDGVPNDELSLKYALRMTDPGNKADLRVSYAPAYTADCQASQVALIGCINTYIGQKYNGSWVDAITIYSNAQRWY